MSLNDFWSAIQTPAIQQSGSRGNSLLSRARSRRRRSENNPLTRELPAIERLEERTLLTALAETGADGTAIADVDRIQQLGFRSFPTLTPAEIGFLTNDQVASIPSDWWLNRIPAESRSALATEQIQSLNVGRTGIRRLSEGQRSEITVEQIQTLSLSNFRYLNASQTPHLTTEQIASISNNWWLRSIPESARAALTSDQIQALNTSATGIRGLSSDQIASLTADQIGTLKYYEFERLSADQIPHLTTEQVGTIPSNGWLRRIPTESRAALTKDQVRALNTAGTGVRGLTPVQITHLTGDQVRSLTYYDLERLSPPQISELSAEQVATIPSNGWLRRIPSEARAAFTANQVQALNTAKTGIRGLTAEQIAQLTGDQVRTLTYYDFERLTPSQIPELTAEQVATIPSNGWLRRIPSAARAALTPEQVQALNTAKTGIRGLTAGQIGHLTGDQVRTLTYYDFERLTPSQIPELTAEQVATIPSNGWLRRIPSAGRAALTPEQVQALNTAKTGIRGLTAGQIAHLTGDQVRTLTYYDFERLSPSQIPELTAEQVATVPSNGWLRRIPSAARAALTPEQVQALNTAKTGIRGLTVGQIAQLTGDQVRTLTYYDFERLSPSQIPELTADQVATIPSNGWLRRIPSAARAALTSDQVQALNTAKTGIRGLTPSQIAHLTGDQVRTLTYYDFERLAPAQIPALTTAQVGSIPSNGWLRRIPELPRAAFTQVQVQALNSESVGVRGLTDRQVDYLSAQQIQTLDYYDLPRLDDQQTPVLTSTQISEIPSTGWFERIASPARSVLSPEQVQALDTYAVSIRALTPAQRRSLTVQQIQSVRQHDLRHLVAEQVPFITNEQMARVTDAGNIMRMPDDAEAMFSNDQLLSLAPRVEARLMGQGGAMAAPAAPRAESHDHASHSSSGMDGHDHSDSSGPHGDDPDKHHEHQALFDLVPHAEATYVSVVSGDWSDPNVWDTGTVPGEDANVLISHDTTVSFDVIQTDPVNWVRIDGTLSFDTDVDTQLYGDTFVVDPAGVLQIGTDADPVDDDVAARIVIADRGTDIDQTWDPNQLSRGVISHGSAELHGESVTPFVSLAVDPSRGDTQLVLDTAPTNWNVGDQLVLTGTNPNVRAKHDEELEIVAIDGNVITVDHALEHHHRTPAGHDAKVYVANMNRNVVIMSENPSINQRRGHVMFMHNQNIDINNVGFYGLGRTDKRNPANDPVFDDHGQLIADTGLNPRGRYSVHVHRAGTSFADNPGWITGSAVVDSPGWGFVNHESYVHMHDNVAYNVVGASFVTENGNEIGSFERNLSIRTTGSGQGLESREEIFDFGHNGHGFWFQGPGVEVIDNVSATNNDAAFIFFTSSSEARFLTENMVDPSLAAGRESVPVGVVPLRTVRGNEAFSSRTGLETWFHLTHVNAGQSVIEDFTTWNNRGRAVFTPYTGRTVLRDIVTVGNPNNPRGTAFGRNDVTNNIRYENVTVDGFEVGISVPVRRHTEIIDGDFSAVRAIDVKTAVDTIRDVDIVGDPQFATLTDRQLRGREQFDIYLNGDINLKNRDVETYFSPDIVRLGTVKFNDSEVYYHKQAADYVPFPSDGSPEWIPAMLLDKTNTELWSEYGIAPAGTVAPADAVEVNRINGLVGSRTDYQPRLQLLSRKYTNQLDGYQLRYRDPDGNNVTDPTLVDLEEGWNLLTREVDGATRTFFVFGDLEAPVFTLNPNRPLAVNPNGLEFGFTVRGRVFDNSVGDMMFKRRFNDLEHRTILTRADGSQYILLEFTISDRAGNQTHVSLELNLDPNAPLVPGTGQQDLPERELPEILVELIDFYFII